MMNEEKYNNIVKKYKPKEQKLKSVFLAFCFGGCIGVSSEILYQIFLNIFALEKDVSMALVTIIMIGLSCLFTALGFFDNLVRKFKCGLIIPTTGFAHSMASAILDYKNDGYITGIGSNAFKLAGSVILYGIFFAALFCIVKVII